MVHVLSKLAPISVTCEQYVHPWTDSCAKATTGLFLYAILDSLRVYSTFYVLALLMKGRIPKLDDIRKTIAGILRSTAFLSFNGFGYSGFLCLLRKFIGSYNILTVSGLPAFLASFFAILIERPSRRPLLALYVTNIATEVVWKMLVARNIVRTIPKGEIAIFAGSLAVLMTYFKSGCHKIGTEKHPDSMFSILKFVFGPHEEKDCNARSSQASNIHRRNENEGEANANNSRWATPKRSSNNLIYSLVMKALRFYRRNVYKLKCCNRHSTCPHPFSCVYNTLHRSGKMFSIGIAFQMSLQVLFNLRSMLKSPASIANILMQKKNLNIAMFLGGTSGLFTAIMCLLRRVTGHDSAIHAFPAGLVAGMAFYKYPDNTIALYVFWKLLQITTNMGIEKGYFPNVPGFIILLYSLSTAILFHAALVEPLTLRSSYWKFLHNLSGGRVTCMCRDAMDVWGLKTTDGFAKVVARNRTEPIIRYFLVK